MLTILANAARKAGVHAETQIVDSSPAHSSLPPSVACLEKQLTEAQAAQAAQEVARVANLKKQLTEERAEQSALASALKSMAMDLELQLKKLGAQPSSTWYRTWYAYQ